MARTAGRPALRLRTARLTAQTARLTARTACLTARTARLRARTARLTARTARLTARTARLTAPDGGTGARRLRPFSLTKPKIMTHLRLQVWGIQGLAVVVHYVSAHLIPPKLAHLIPPKSTF